MCLITQSLSFPYNPIAYRFEKDRTIHGQTDGSSPQRHQRQRPPTQHPPRRRSRHKAEEHWSTGSAGKYNPAYRFLTLHFRNLCLRA